MPALHRLVDARLEGFRPVLGGVNFGRPRIKPAVYGETGLSDTRLLDENSKPIESLELEASLAVELLYWCSGEPA
jgi:hypothetical protein